MGLAAELYKYARAAPKTQVPVPLPYPSKAPVPHLFLKGAKL